MNKEKDVKVKVEMKEMEVERRDGGMNLMW